MSSARTNVAALLLGLMAAWLACCPAEAKNQSTRLVTEETMIDSPQPGLKIFVRNKHPAGMTHFSPGRTLLFVHGATYPASAAFDLELGGTSWMDYIASHGYDVYLIDLPGYGRSTRPPAMDQPAEASAPVETTAQAVQDYAAVADWVLARRKIARLDVAGWSWGTTIAAGFASEHPDKVNRLVLYAPVWLAQGEPAAAANPLSSSPTLGGYRMVTADAALKRWMNGVPEAKRADLIPAGWFDTWQKATWATDPKSGGADPPALRAPNGVTLDFQRFWAAGKPTYDPAGITAPTLLIVAEWDRDTPPARAQGLFPLLTHTPWKQLVLLGEGTHTVVMERNRLLLFQAVQAFLDEKQPK